MGSGVYDGIRITDNFGVTGIPGNLPSISTQLPKGQLHVKYPHPPPQNDRPLIFFDPLAGHLGGFQLEGVILKKPKIPLAKGPLKNCRPPFVRTGH